MPDTYRRKDNTEKYPTCKDNISAIVLEYNDIFDKNVHCHVQPYQSDYEKIAVKIGKLVQDKQIAYGDSFNQSGKVMQILYPNGIPVDKYDDALTVIRVIDKLFCIATCKDAFSESLWKDIAGYAILSLKEE